MRLISPLMPVPLGVITLCTFVHATGAITLIYIIYILRDYSMQVYVVDYDSNEQQATVNKSSRASSDLNF